MKRFILLSILSIMIITTSSAQEKKFIKGYDGGMMVHTGYVTNSVSPLDYYAEGPTFGIGGLVKLRLSDHFRNGVEGYISTMGQMENGSYSKVFWSGSTFDFFWQMGKWMPYVGLTTGGGTVTHFLMFEGDKHDWVSEPVSYFNKKAFFAIDPYLGCDFCLTEAMHLTMRLDYLFAVAKDAHVPQGPRLYFGFIFSH